MSLLTGVVAVAGVPTAVKYRLLAAVGTLPTIATTTTTTNII